MLNSLGFGGIAAYNDTLSYKANFFPSKVIVVNNATKYFLLSKQYLFLADLTKI